MRKRCAALLSCAVSSCLNICTTTCFINRMAMRHVGCDLSGMDLIAHSVVIEEAHCSESRRRGPPLSNLQLFIGLVIAYRNGEMKCRHTTFSPFGEAHRLDGS